MNGAGSKSGGIPREKARHGLVRAAFRAAVPAAGIIVLAGCDLAKEAPPLSLGQVRAVREVEEVAPTPKNVKAVTVTASKADAPSPALAGPVDVVFGGDVVPQARMLSENPSDLLQGALPLLAADGFVFNLEGPVGSRKSVPRDKTTLAFATPASWLGKLLDASHATAFGAANNHACDLEQEGPLATQAFADEQKATALGIGRTSPWRARVVAAHAGKRVCALAWTTFLNDERKRHDTCRKGRGDILVARAGLDPEGYAFVRKVVADEATWEGCDARVAYVHGGIEYRPQSAKMMYLAHVIAPSVDAVVFAHTHVPDGVELLSVDGSSRQRKVPVFRSLGNLLSNQGAAWSEGMATTLLGDRGAGDPIRTVWTRVAMLARLRFEFGAGEKAPPGVSYGYDLAFMDRAGSHPTLMPLTHDSPIGEQLKRGAFGALMEDRCRRADGGASDLPCRSR
ncbi:MAG: CapA family protein [Polyangiaceae bacterium]